MNKSQKLLILFSLTITTQQITAGLEHSRGNPCSDALFTALEEVNAIQNQLTNSSDTCAATPISQVDFDLTQTYTITTPGNYCLTENCIGMIVINGSNVTLDLNGFDLSNFGELGFTAIIITGDYVTVKNGSVTAINPSHGGEHPRGIIFVNNSNYCTLQDLTINFCHDNICTRSPTEFGMLLIESSNNVIVERVLAYSSGDANKSLNALSVTNFFVLDSLFNSNKSIIDSCSNILVSGCSFRNAAADFGLKCSSCTNLFIINSNALGNTSYGFTLDVGTNNFEIINCNAIENKKDGIHVDSNCDNGIIDSCNALSNGSIVTVGSGFNVNGTGNTSIIVQNCDANNNTGFGFLSGTASVRFWNNAAINNNHGGGDYNIIASGDPVLAIGDPNFAAGYNVAGVA